MNLPRLSGKANPDNGATTAEWLRDDPDETRPYFGELRLSDDERAEQAEARAELAEQERDGERRGRLTAEKNLDALKRDHAMTVNVLRDQIAELTARSLPVIPAGHLVGDPVLPAVPEHDLSLVEVGSTPLDTPETDWDEWLRAWRALPKRVPGEPLAELEAEA